VVLYLPDERTAAAWPGFVGDAAHALRSAGVRFEVDRTLPAPSRVNHLFNAFLCSHVDDLASTGEIPRREAIPAVLLALLSRGRLDRRIHPNTAVLLALTQLGSLTFYRDAPRYEGGVEALRATMAALWRSGRLVVAPTTTRPPPRHGRAVFAWTWQAYCKLGNLTDATALALPFGRFSDGMPRSLQILGPPGSERAVLDLAERLEPVTPR
jgi:Asp-tRNA(Asn)/Glu-tRNA(Gln) amidotransferase A subunit family amidase